MYLLRKIDKNTRTKTQETLDVKFTRPKKTSTLTKKLKTKLPQNSPEHTLQTKVDLANKYGNGIKINGDHGVQEYNDFSLGLDYEKFGESLYRRVKTNEFWTT